MTQQRMMVVVGAGLAWAGLAWSLLAAGCGSSRPPRVQDPLVTVADRATPPAERVRAGREAIARAGEDAVAKRAVYRELVELATSPTDDVVARGGALATMMQVEDSEARAMLREAVSRSVAWERDASVLAAKSKLVAQQGWKEAVPGLVLALARPWLIASDGYGLAGPRAVETATLSFGGIGQTATLSANARAGAVLAFASDGEAQAAARDALASLLPGDASRAELWGMVVRAGPGGGLALEKGASGEAVLGAVRSGAERAKQAREIERLRLAAYDVLVRQELVLGGANGLAGPQRAGQAMDAFAGGGEGSVDKAVVERLQWVRRTYGELPASGEGLRQALSMRVAADNAPEDGPGGLGERALRRWHQSRGGTGDVWTAAGALAAEESVRAAWRRQLDLDDSDGAAAYGGWIVLSEAGLVARVATPRAAERGGNLWFTPTVSMLDGTGDALVWYRLHAEGNAEDGPDARDRWLAEASGRVVLVVRRVRGGEARVWALCGTGVQEVGTVVLPSGGGQ